MSKFKELHMKWRVFGSFAVVRFTKILEDGTLKRQYWIKPFPPKQRRKDPPILPTKRD